MPARRKAPMTRMLSSRVGGGRARSGRARRAAGAISASTSSVAAMPMGSRPQISPTSWPTLSGLLTPTPDELERGVADDLGDHELADEAGAPDDDALGRGRSSGVAAQRIISPAFTIRCWPVTAFGVGRRRRTWRRRRPRRPRSCGASGKPPTMLVRAPPPRRCPCCLACLSTYICTGGPHIHDGTTMLQRMLSAPELVGEVVHRA